MRPITILAELSFQSAQEVTVCHTQPHPHPQTVSEPSL